MDDDDLRRGQPTVHMAFDEATRHPRRRQPADATPSTSSPTPETALSDAAQADAGAGAGARRRHRRHGRRPGARPRRRETGARTRPGIVTLQAMKTGALIRFACEAGADRCRRADAERERLAAVRRDDRPCLPARRRPARPHCRCRDHGQGNRQGRRARQGHAGGAARHRHGREAKLAEHVKEAEAYLAPYGERRHHSLIQPLASLPDARAEKASPAQYFRQQSALIGRRSLVERAEHGRQATRSRCIPTEQETQACMRS